MLAALADGAQLLQRDLAEKARVEQPSVATLLARMERDGIIAREPDSTDKRASRYTLTRKAKTRLPAATHVIQEVVDIALRGFSKSEKITLIALLRRIVENLDSQREASL